MTTKKTPLPPGVNPALYGTPFTVDDYQGMPYRFLGGTGLRVSNIGLGTWKIGYPATGDGSRVDEKTAFKLFDKAVEEGVTFWDTANRYNNASGNSERIIGRWLAANPGSRRSIELATKMYGLMDGTTPNFCRLSRINIMESVYASLERLQTDRIEVLQFHGYDDTVPVEESLLAVEDLISQDLVGYLGLCNVSLAELAKFEERAGDFPRAKIRSVQNQFDVLGGEDPARAGVLARCAMTGLSFIAWSPLRGGLLSGRYLDRSAIKAGDRLLDENRVDKELTPARVRKLEALASIAREAALTMTQLVLAYMRTIPGMGPVIAGCTTPEQLVENAKAGKVTLAAEQTEAVRQALAGA